MNLDTLIYLVCMAMVTSLFVAIGAVIIGITIGAAVSCLRIMYLEFRDMWREIP